jgi:D-alanyl-D-alanine carboxypeptidase (penicillin-binding protein 5/6)
VAASPVHLPLRSLFSQLAALFALVAVFASTPAGPATAAPTFDPRRFAAIVEDASTGEVLYERNAGASRFPASLTKVMTVYVVFDAIEKGELHMDDKVVMSAHAASRPPSKLGLAVGDSLTVRQAINILVVRSANDLAAALAEKVSGSESAFARRMTATARRLGMKHTRFVNASGLPDRRHKTTARDLAILARAFLRDHPEAYSVFDLEQTKFRGRTIRGHNALIRQPGIDGFKTGFTNASGFNLMTSGIANGHRIIAVVLGGPTARVRDKFMSELMRSGFAYLALRDAGMTATFAQVLGSGRPIMLAAKTGRRAPPTLAQGDDDDDDAKPAAGRRRHWWMQVGAFKSKSLAKKHLADVRRRHPKRFGAAHHHLKRSGGFYLARFAASNRKAAERGCAVVRRKGRDCLVVLESGSRR